MLVLKFKDKRYNRKVKFVEDSFQNLYYALDNYLFSTYERFEETEYISNLTNFNYDYYLELLENNDNEADDYYCFFTDFIEEIDYRFFIEDLFSAKGYTKDDYNIEMYNVYYFDEIVEYYNLSYLEKEEINKKLLATGKVEMDFNCRLYTEDITLYEQLEIELEDY